MSSLIYLGNPPKTNQTVLPSLSQRGINLNKGVPSRINAIISVEDVHPHQPLYTEFLSVFVKVAQNGGSQLLKEPWHYFNASDDMPSWYTDPQIIFSFTTQLNSDQTDHIIGKYRAQETVIKNKPAFLATLTPNEMRQLIDEPNIIDTTPTNPSCLNINGSRGYRYCCRVLHAMMKVNQYSYHRNNDPLPEVGDTHINNSRIQIVGDVEIFHTDTIMDGDGDEQDQHRYRIPPSKMKAFCNLTEPYTMVQTQIQAPAEIPPEHTGLIVPYIEELAEPDYWMIPEFFQRYWKYAFGNGPAASLALYNDFKSNVGVLPQTVWGKQIAHICWCLDIAFRSQSTQKMIVDSAGNYQAMMILGGGYTIQIHNGEARRPQEIPSLERDFTTATPHASAVKRIFSRIPYNTAPERAQAQEGCTTMNQLRLILSIKAINEADKREIMNDARYLHFPLEPPTLACTSHNLETVLNTIKDSSQPMDGFHLHYTQLFGISRLERMLSAFGPVAPSFLVPGGRKMMLEAAFETTRKVKGVMQQIAVHKVSVIMRPLEDAITDLKKVMLEKAILNPHGTAVVNRVSSDSILRSFSEADGVIAALRNFAEVSVMNTVGAGTSTKRKRDAEDDGGPARRTRMYDF